MHVAGVRIRRRWNEKSGREDAPAAFLERVRPARYFAASALATRLSLHALSATLSFCGISFAA